MKFAAGSLLENLRIRLRIDRQSNFAAVCRVVAAVCRQYAPKRLCVVPNGVTMEYMYRDTTLMLNLDLR
jgi:hypothetical protein